MANKRSISRLLSLMLRHRPDEFGLEIDRFGFVPVGQVVQAVGDRYEEAGEGDVLELVNSPDQRRFEIVEGRIRALYGHSFFVEMDGEPLSPPELLYMGTTAAEAGRYGADGIIPTDRFYVHLSLSREAAAERSRELDGPVVVEVRARQAAAEGVIFHTRGEVVLTRQVPAQFVGEAYGVVITAAPRLPAPLARSEGADRRSRSGRRPPPRAALAAAPGEAPGGAFIEAPVGAPAEAPTVGPVGEPDRVQPTAAISYGRKLRKATRR